MRPHPTVPVHGRATVVFRPRQRTRKSRLSQQSLPPPPLRLQNKYGKPAESVMQTPHMRPAQTSPLTSLQSSRSTR
ncbi:hypothetical protein IF2G_02656 [Cordyceps javanica]|nr:hypothetical protein IF2G_02656 [Cordyceps javanica]